MLLHTCFYIFYELALGALYRNVTVAGWTFVEYANVIIQSWRLNCHMPFDRLGPTVRCESLSDKQQHPIKNREQPKR